MDDDDLKALKEKICESTYQSDYWKPKRDYSNYVLLFIITVLILSGAVW